MRLFKELFCDFLFISCFQGTTTSLFATFLRLLSRKRRRRHLPGGMDGGGGRGRWTPDIQVGTALRFFCDFFFCDSCNSSTLVRKTDTRRCFLLLFLATSLRLLRDFLALLEMGRSPTNSECHRVLLPPLKQCVPLSFSVLGQNPTNTYCLIQSGMEIPPPCFG